MIEAPKLTSQPPFLKHRRNHRPPRYRPRRQTEGWLNLFGRCSPYNHERLNYASFRHHRNSLKPGHNPHNCILIKPVKIQNSSSKTSNTQNHKKSELKLVHVNIRSLKNRNNLIQLRQLTYKQQYDILTISESWLNSTVKNSDVQIEGYKLLCLDRLGKQGGGVCVYTRTSLKTNIIKDISEISQTGFHQLWLQIQSKKIKSILLCVVYRPPDCSVSCFMEDFLENYTYALDGILHIGKLHI